MVFIADWEDFSVKAWELASKSPATTRYTLKLLSQKAQLVLKVTNNRETYRYSSQHLEAEFNKIKTFGLTLTRLLTKETDTRKSSKHHKKQA